MNTDCAQAVAPASTQSEHGAFAQAYPDGIQKHYWSRARNRIVYDLVRRCGRPDEPVLEIGCARGVVAAYLRRRGVDCWGVDLEASEPMDTSIAPYLRTGVDVFDLAPGWLSRFSTLLMLDVLEHIEHPAEFVRHVLDRATGTRALGVTMPARMELWSNYDEHYGHYLRYDRRSLFALAGDTGLAVRSWGYAFRPLLPPAWVLNKLGMARSTTIRSPSPMMRPLHGLVGGVMAIECSLLPAAIPGSSIYAVLERKDP